MSKTPKKSYKGKVIITGPGRAGTTFLVMLLTRMGLDTGFKPYKETFILELRAGCEKSTIFDEDFKASKRRMDRSPEILKAPNYSFFIKNYVQSGLVRVRHVIIPVRDLTESAKSRLSVNLRWCIEDHEGVEEQEKVVAEALGRAVEACVVCKIPCTILRFPDLVNNVEYLYSQLSPIFKIGRARFMKVFNELQELKKLRNEGRCDE